MTSSITILTFIYGRWEWWPLLYCVDFIPKGKKKPTVTIGVPEKDNTYSGALKRVIMYMHKHRNNVIEGHLKEEL